MQAAWKAFEISAKLARGLSVARGLWEGHREPRKQAGQSLTVSAGRDKGDLCGRCLLE